MFSIKSKLRFRVSLRMFLLLVTVFAVGVGMHSESAHRQRVAVEALRAMGATVRYDYETPETAKPVIVPRNDGTFERRYISQVPQWLINRLGVDFFHSAIYVEVPYGHERQALQHLERMPRLKVLYLSVRRSHRDAIVDELRRQLRRVDIRRNTTIPVVG